MTFNTNPNTFRWSHLTLIWSTIWCTCDMHKKNIRKPHEHAPVHRHACRTSAKYIQILTFTRIAWVSFSSKDPRRTKNNGPMPHRKCGMENGSHVTNNYSFASYVQNNRSHQKGLQGLFFGCGSSHLSYIYLQNSGILELQYKQWLVAPPKWSTETPHSNLH